MASNWKVWYERPTLGVLAIDAVTGYVCGDPDQPLE